MSILAPPVRPVPFPRPERSDLDRPLIEDQIIHGWRWVTRRTFDGIAVDCRIPLSAEDVLHPQLGDEIMCTSAHQDTCWYLRGVCADRTSGIPSTIVLTDTGVNLDLPDVATISPDVAVIPNVRERKNWSVFFCKEEGTKPNLMVEITSPHRRENDTEKKFVYYFNARIPCYVIVDLVNVDANGVPPILGYEWTETGFRSMVPDARGRLWLEAIRVWIEPRPYGVGCYDENNVLIPDFVGVRQAQREAEEQARKDADARREAEEQARNAVAAQKEMGDQLQRLQAEMAKLRGDAKTP